MVEISLSGSGGGPGKATTRGYPTVTTWAQSVAEKMTAHETYPRDLETQVGPRLEPSKNRAEPTSVNCHCGPVVAVGMSLALYATD